jgi:hypothetical protein
MHHKLVWMIEEQVTAELVNFGAYTSRVKFFYEGLLYDEIVMNDEFILYSELGIEQETIDE